MGLFLGGFVILISIYCITLTKFTAGVCIGLHNDSVGLTFKDVEITTALSRSFYKQPCPSEGEKPCHVYLTLGDEASDVFVNFHINEQICNPAKIC